MTAAMTLKADRGPRKARLTIEQFYRVATSGALDDYAKAELLDGGIHVMNAQFLPHMRMKRSVFLALQTAVIEAGLGLEVGIEGAIELGDDSAPEPDIFLFVPVETEQGVPGEKVRLVIEIADSSERRDLGYKKRIYARHGIPEYWVVVLRTGMIERFANPVEGHYRVADSIAADGPITSMTIGDLHIPAGVQGGDTR